MCNTNVHPYSCQCIIIANPGAVQVLKSKVNKHRGHYHMWWHSQWN